MRTVIIIIGLIIVLIVIPVIYRILTVRKQNRKLSEQRFNRIKPLYDRLENGEELTTEDVLPYAQNMLTRETIFQLLNTRNRSDVFPKEYYSIIKGAESRLANWLEFPTELDACPDEVEYIKRVSFDLDGQNNFVHYEVFRYRVNEPHWASKDGWIIGVVGPYFDDSKPYDNAQATFSRVGGKLDKVTPDEEAKWVHENIAMKR